MSFCTFKKKNSGQLTKIQMKFLNFIKKKYSGKENFKKSKGPISPWILLPLTLILDIFVANTMRC